MKFDLSFLKEPLNHMAMQLAIILIVPLVVGLLVKWGLRSVKLPNSVSNFGAVLVLLYVFYKTVIIVLG
jgi:hypothetical protein